MFSYAKFSAAELPGSVGREADGWRLSEGAGGHICFGPYLAMPAGRYVAGFHIQALAPSRRGDELHLDVVHEPGGGSAVAERRWKGADVTRSTAGFVWLDFELGQDIKGLEVRLNVSSGFRIGVRDLVIFASPSRMAPT